MRYFFLIMFFWSYQPILAHNWDKNNIVLFANIEIFEDKLSMGLSIPADLFNQILVHRFRFDTALSVEQQKQIYKEVLDDLNAHNPIQADQQKLSPHIKEMILILTAPQEQVEQESLKVEGISMHSNNNTTTLIMIEYPFPKKSPKSISIQWTSDVLWMSLEKRVTTMSSKIMSGIISHGEQVQFLRLTRDEPEFIWHKPVENINNKIQSQKIPVPKPFTPPILSYLLLLIALLSPIILKSSLAFNRRLVISIALLSMAYAVKGITPWQFERHKLDQEEIISVFKQKHQGIYDAFESQSESQVYDALAKQVHGDLLDHIYQSTYQSLIMPEENGARSKIKNIKYLKTEVMDTPQKLGQYQIKATWQVTGEVKHWGHEHQRVNEYSAIYRISPIEDEFFITEIEVLSQKRKAELEKNGF